MAALELRARCTRCGHIESRIVTDPVAGDVEVGCPKCGAWLIRYRPVLGFVYLLSNPLMPDVVKIGSTTRLVEDRVQELNSATGVPAPFKIEAYFATSRPPEGEAAIHKALSHVRVPA
jgi:hypothetical protein